MRRCIRNIRVVIAHNNWIYICHNKSLIGSNMMDSDNEDNDMCHGHPKWGSFNEERAMRKSGDGRAAFLRFEGSELLYW